MSNLKILGTIEVHRTVGLSYYCLVGIYKRINATINPLHHLYLEEQINQIDKYTHYIEPRALIYFCNKPKFSYNQNL